MKRKLVSVLVALALVACACCGALAEAASFAGGSGTAEDPWQIATVEQLAAVREHLDGHFILIADIDLAGEDFAPIGAFEPLSASEEDAETPAPEVAFTGTFDGDGHVISNVAISRPESVGVGLFGCVTGEAASVSNLRVENVTVEGLSMVGGVIGFAHAGNAIEGIELSGTNAISGYGLVGGIVGGGFNDISNCTAVANVTMNGDGAQGAGIIVGGLEDGSVENCQASGTVTALGTGCFSVGGLAGCFQESAYAKDCVAQDVTLTVGEDGFLIGGLVGHAGASEAPTRIENCRAIGYAIEAGEGAQRIGGIVGGGFYASAYVEYYPEPNAFVAVNCEAQGTVTGGEFIGSIAGYVHDNSSVENCTGEEPQIGADAQGASLEQMK